MKSVSLDFLKSQQCIKKTIAAFAVVLILNAVTCYSDVQIAEDCTRRQLKMSEYNISLYKNSFEYRFINMTSTALQSVTGGWSPNFPTWFSTPYTSLTQLSNGAMKLTPAGATGGSVLMTTNVLKPNNSINPSVAKLRLTVEANLLGEGMIGFTSQDSERVAEGLGPYTMYEGRAAYPNWFAGLDFHQASVGDDSYVSNVVIEPGYDTDSTTWKFSKLLSLVRSHTDSLYSYYTADFNTTIRNDAIVDLQGLAYGDEDGELYAYNTYTIDLWLTQNSSATAKSAKMITYINDIQTSETEWMKDVDFNFHDGVRPTLIVNNARISSSTMRIFSIRAETYV